jgi:hypothetical protein
MGPVLGPFSVMAARALVVAAAAALVGAGCGRSPSPGAQSPTSAATLPPATLTPSTTARATPTTERSPPTTAWVASAPQPSPDLAAAQLVEAWAEGKRAAAASVASPPAVAALFAAAYPGQSLALSRGCSSQFLPIVCTYGPPGGASPNDALFQVDASPTAGGWYVSSVRVLP